MSAEQQQQQQQTTFGGSVFSSSTFPIEQYVQHRPIYPASLLDFIPIVPAEESAIALELGCGPGNTTNFLLNRGYTKIIAVDSSDTMIQYAKSQQSKSNTHIEYRVANVDDLHFIPTGSISTVLCLTAAHWFPNSWWAELSRILSPDKKSLALLGSYSGFLAIPTIQPGKWQSTFDSVISWLWGEISQHITQGNKVHQSLYTKLPLPNPDLGLLVEVRYWHASDQARQYDLNIDTTVANLAENPTDPKMLMQETITLDDMLLQLATFGPFVRWQEHNNDQPIASRQDNIISVARQMFKDAGVPDDIMVHCTRAVGLMLVRKAQSTV